MVGVLLFARELVGGGDVKLIAALSLWAGLEHFAMFALVTTLTGGILGLAILWFQRWSPVIHAHLAGFGLAAPVAPAPRSPRAAEPGPPASAAPATLPYGIAIAAGGVAVVIELMKL